MTTVTKHRELLLVVEDDLDSRLAMGEVLQRAGYLVETAPNALEGLQMAAHTRPDLVLTDMQMPGLNGIELIRRLHIFAPSVPVVLTTGMADTKNLLTATAGYGAVACLKKPMDVDNLLWTIESALVVARQRQAHRKPTGAPRAIAHAR